MKKALSLSTSNSKNYKKALLKITLFIAIFMVINFWIGLKLENVDDKKNLYATVKWKEFYEMPSDTLDLVFVGSSHAYRSFDPQIFDKKLSINSFNMGSPLQKPIESYYVLKETLKHQKPSLVIYDMYWGVFNKDKYFNSKVWNFDNIKFSTNKIGYLLKVFDVDQYFNATFKSVRYHENMSTLVKTLLGKNIENKNESIQDYLAKYKGKGFIIDENTITLDEIENKFKNSKGNAKQYHWDEEQIKFFNKTVKLCKDQNIDLIIVTSPIAPSYLEKYNNYWYCYDKIHETASNMADQNKLKYLDYNIINQVDNIVTDSDYSDTNHLNYNGAQKISLDLANHLKKFYNKLQ